MKWLEEKHVQVERPIDNFVRVFIGHQVAATGSAQQLLASSLSFYLCMYICILSKSQVSEMHTLHNFPFIPDANTSEQLKSEEQTLVANSTAFLRGWRY